MRKQWRKGRRWLGIVVNGWEPPRRISTRATTRAEAMANLRPAGEVVWMTSRADQPNRQQSVWEAIAGHG